MTTSRLERLDPAARDLAARSIAWMDADWDEDAGMLCSLDGRLYEEITDRAVHVVRETGYYALGLLLRQGSGDTRRALVALDRLLDWQLDAPGQPYHGTWRRAAQEPVPPAAPREWHDYDPNWREFVGTTLAMILLEYEALLPDDLKARIDIALKKAVVGALERRLSPTYTNIALMQAFLLWFAGERFGEAAWVGAGEQLGAEIAALFAVHGTFAEYNSPTYYSVDLYALALWRSYASPTLRALGAEMEARLWIDIAQFYHAGMKNLCGPFDRSYGMDMRRYAAGLGMWIWLAAGREGAPFPDTDQPFEHAWDFCGAPAVAILGLAMPREALPHFTAFQGEREVERVITETPRRVATAWLDELVMIGAEAAGPNQRIWDQFHPATLHWRQPDGAVGWAKLRHTAPVAARAERGALHISGATDGAEARAFVLEVFAPDVSEQAFEHDRWRLPGLVVQVETNAEGPAFERKGELVELRYVTTGQAAPPHFTLCPQPSEAHDGGR